RVRRQRAETHRRNIEQTGVVWLFAGRPSDADAKVRIGDAHRRCRMGKPGVTGAIDVLDGAKRALVLHAFGALVDKAAILTAERNLIIVALDQILAYFGPEAL